MILITANNITVCPFFWKIENFHLLRGLDFNQMVLIRDWKVYRDFGGQSADLKLYSECKHVSFHYFLVTVCVTDNNIACVRPHFFAFWFGYFFKRTQKETIKSIKSKWSIYRKIVYILCMYTQFIDCLVNVNTIQTHTLTQQLAII